MDPGLLTPHHIVQGELGVAQEGWVSESQGLPGHLGQGEEGSDHQE